jgi:hypothetical protein
MDNYLIIRFSIKYPDNAHIMWSEAEKNIANIFSDRESWFKYRADLFEASYLSFKFQTVPPKNIFLICDTADQNLFFKYIEPRFNVIPIFGSNLDWKRKYIEQILKLSSKNVVLSRVDSDDLIDKHYFENINLAISESSKNFDDLMVIAPCGQITDGKQVQQTILNLSPFLSLYCPKYNGQDVYLKSNMLCLTYKHIFCQHARWIQRVHGSNVNNKFRQESLGLEKLESMLFIRDLSGEFAIEKISHPFMNSSSVYKL